MNTINDILSRLRGRIKSVSKDAFVTDRAIYSLVQKFAPGLLKREDSKNLLLTIQGIFQTLHFVELIEVNKVESRQFHLNTDCVIKRSALKLPKLYMGYNAPLIKSVTCLSGHATDGNDEAVLKLIEPAKYAFISKSKSFKYNTTKYCWFADGYLWFPNLQWDAVRVEGLFEEDVTGFNDGCMKCNPRQQHHFSVPEYLYPELEQFIFTDLGISLKVPSDIPNDKSNVNRY